MAFGRNFLESWGQTLNFRATSTLSCITFSSLLYCAVYEDTITKTVQVSPWAILKIFLRASSDDQPAVLSPLVQRTRLTDVKVCFVHSFYLTTLVFNDNIHERQTHTGLLGFRYRQVWPITVNITDQIRGWTESP
jgi:hypothetical protein